MPDESTRDRVRCLFFVTCTIFTSVGKSGNSDSKSDTPCTTMQLGAVGYK